jgi:hypothetical protein
MFEWTGAITTGSLSNPRVRDDNDGRQIAGRVIARPFAAIALGTSLARGAYVARAVQDALPTVRAEDGVQQAIGVDAEYSQGRFLARSEIIHSQWRLPRALDDTGDRNLRARTAMLEARYRVLPGVQLAARVERMDFSRLHVAAANATWEAPVSRTELGGSYSIIRNITLKGSWQRNTRDGGRVRVDNLFATQLVYWF